LERLRRRVGRFVAPEVLDQLVGGDDLVGVKEEVGEQGALLCPADRERTGAGIDLERPEDLELNQRDPRRTYHGST
jgi:hypothetical protein